MKVIPGLTLCIVDCQNYGGAATAMKKSLEQITPDKAIFLTDIPIKLDGIEVIQIPAIKSKEDYSRFIIKELYKYFETDYILLIQHDGYVINGEAWQEEFKDCDFIGAPWLYPDKDRNVGNGGVSLRSRQLQYVLGTDEEIEIIEPEDEIIGRLYRRYLEEVYTFKFAPEDLADHFSYELRTPIYDTFAFHGRFHKPYQKTVRLRREGALGDVIALEPVMSYFNDKGYRIVLETLPQFYLLFMAHHYKIHRPEELDPRLLKQVKTFNLDLSYESKPEQLHLKTYYEFCGIEDGEIKAPRLTVGFPITKETKLFKKYAVIHIDKRAQPGRNIYGIDWWAVSAELRSQGYTVIQIGKGEHEDIPGAVYVNATNENFLCYLVGGADLFIGIDSGPSNIAVAFGVKSIILSGSVDLRLIHPDMSNITWIHNHDKAPCNKPFCWHSAISTTGVECYVDEKNPPCVQFETEKILTIIKKHEQNTVNTTSY